MSRALLLQRIVTGSYRIFWASNCNIVRPFPVRARLKKEARGRPNRLFSRLFTDAAAHAAVATALA